MCGIFGAAIGVAFAGPVPSDTAAGGFHHLMELIKEWVIPFGLVGLLLGMVPGFLAALAVWLFAPRE